MPFKAVLHAWENENGIPATFNFGISEKDENTSRYFITAGLDIREKYAIKIPDRIKNLSLADKLKESAERVATQTKVASQEAAPQL